MRISTPDPKPRDNGDYRVIVGKGYGNPTGDIELDEDGTLILRWLDEADCDRLIKAATEVRQKVTAQRAEMKAPHGRRHMYQGTCQLCGQPEDAALHAEPESETGQ